MEIHFSSPNLANIYMDMRAYVCVHVWEKISFRWAEFANYGLIVAQMYTLFSIFA